MKNLKLFSALMLLAALLTNCKEDEDPQVMPHAGTISGGPFTFIVDGIEDMVTGITLDDSEAVGASSSWVITDDAGNILGLPPTLTDVEGVNFDGAGEGVCLIWYLRYESITGLAVGENTDDLSGSFDFSNSITVTRNGFGAGVLTGGPFEFVVDGNADMVSGIQLDDSDITGMNQTYVITDDNNNILGIPPDMAALEGVNFDGAGAGVCLIWHLSYQDGLTGLEAGNNVSDLVGVYGLSNSIMVTRNAIMAGTIAGGPFTFIVDGAANMVSGITLDDTNVNGPNTNWVITDPDGKILGLPPTLTDVEGVNFDGAGPGICLIWHLTYGDNLEGLEVGMNANDLMGDFALSNSIAVNRSGAAVLGGGEYSFVIDSIPDMADALTVDAANVYGMNTSFVITDDQNNILGLPPTLEAVKGVNFDGAGAGTCLIWHITHEDGLMNLEAGKNVSELEGAYLLSNSITVNRAAITGGTIMGGPFTFTVDGTPDMVTGITLDDMNVNGPLTTWVITDDQGNILGLPPTLTDVEGVNFDGAGVGVCLIWHLTYGEKLEGLEVGKNANDLMGAFSLSNSITVTRE